MSDDDKDKKVIDALKKIGKLPVAYPEDLLEERRNKFLRQIRLMTWFVIIVLILVTVICLLSQGIKF